MGTASRWSASEEGKEVKAAITAIMANVAVAPRVGTMVALRCTALRGRLLCTALRGTLRCTAFRRTLLCTARRGTLLCTAFRRTLLCTALRGTLMRTAAPESCLASRTEAVAVSCKARLGSPHIRYRVTAEPEGIMSAGVADRLGCRRAPGRGVGQQSEHRDCCEPNASQLNIFHLTRSLCDPYA